MSEYVCPSCDDVRDDEEDKEGTGDAPLPCAHVDHAKTGDVTREELANLVAAPDASGRVFEARLNLLAAHIDTFRHPMYRKATELKEFRACLRAMISVVDGSLAWETRKQ